MNETLSYIDDYFTGTLPEAERALFESRITADEAFAEEVAFYLNARQAVRQQLIQQKQKDWVQEETKVTEAPVVKMKATTSWKRILSVAASVLLIVSLSWVFFSNKSDSPQQLAAQYAQQNFTQISAAMGSADSLQKGIEAYNRKDYETAKKLFTGLYTAHPDQTDALIYNGLVSLQQKDYDQAIRHFKMLAGLKLHANPGMFYQAIALLQRNKPGDAEEAQKLLEQVVLQRQEGDKQAKEWLEKF